MRSRDLTGENTINRLRALGVKKGEITFTFDKYHMPDASTRYVIKAEALAVPLAGPRVKPPIPTVRLLEYRPDGFALRVTRGTTLLTIAEIRQIEFMIEVNKF